MKKYFPRLGATPLVAVCIASSVGCYPAYPPGNYGSAYYQDSKGYSVPQEPIPQSPGYVGVDPGLAIAGAAAAGLLGYAIGNNHGHHHDYAYYGPHYYRPAPYYGRGYGRGYYGPRYYR